MNMKLAELQRIENHLKDFTIDDFYLNPNMIYSEIQELMNLESDEELERFLHDSVQKMVNNLNSVLDMSSLNNEIDRCIKNKERLESEITDRRQCLDELDKQFQSVPLTENSLKKEIEDIEEEILQIQPLSEKEPYSSRIEELKAKKSDTANKMDTLAENIKNQKQELIGEIELKESEVQDYENKIKELEQRKQIEPEIFLEFDALAFLCKMLLDEKIEFSLSSRNYYGLGYSDHNDIKDDENIENYFYRIREKGASKISVRFSPVENSLLHFLSSTSPNIVPEDWRKELGNLLNGSLPFGSDFASIKLDATDDNITRYATTKGETKALILSALLSIKQSLMNNHQSLFISDNSIFLSLTGGVMAEIRFREKGKTLKEIREPVFHVINLDYEITNDIALYSQSGYDTTSLKVINGFYVIASGYVVEILFKPAPILFESNHNRRI